MTEWGTQSERFKKEPGTFRFNPDIIKAVNKLFRLCLSWQKENLKIKENKNLFCPPVSLFLCKFWRTWKDATYTFKHSQTSLGSPQRFYEFLLVIFLGQVLHALFHCGSTKQTAHLTFHVVKPQSRSNQAGGFKTHTHTDLYPQYGPGLLAVEVLLWTNRPLSWRSGIIAPPWRGGPSARGDMFEF